MKFEAWEKRRVRRIQYTATEPLGIHNEEVRCFCRLFIFLGTLRKEQLQSPTSESLHSTNLQAR